ncbi:MAG: LTA synthase family protein [Lachnospiraceae bacterium]|nr:LTA synthase family protein [Lachnospiraceae bacterium]
MIQKYFRFDRKRILCFAMISIAIFVLQASLTGSMIARQRVTTEAGNAQSSVIGILDDTEIIRQKFKFKRKVVLTQFSISFGAFDYEKVGTDLHIQMQDGENVIVYENTVPVKEITPNSSYTVKMDHTVTIPRDVACCITLTCSSENNPYAIIPTVNTTNRTDPNLTMSTLNMRTQKKSLTISYTYYYRLVLPLIVMVLEFVLLFVLCFERVTEYAPLLQKKRNKLLRRYQKSGKVLKKRQEIKSVKDFAKWCLANPKVYIYFRRTVMVLNPFILFIMLELLNGTFSKMYPNVWIFTWLLLGAVQLILYGISGNDRLAALMLDFIFFPVGLINFFLMNVRGTPFLPSDILGVTTATEVADTYSLTMTPAQFVVFPAFFIWCLLILRLRRKKTARKLLQKSLRRLIPAVSSVVCIILLYFTPLLERCGIQDSVWNKVASCQNNGFYLNFFINLHYLRVSTPSGYSKAKVEEILEDFTQETVSGSTQEEPSRIVSNRDFHQNETMAGKNPNIILIMNESLADYSLIGDVNFNRDPLEFMHSLREDTIYGKDYVSIYGAGTSNSEFEAMTGNTMKFFPSGCNVYQQFMHDSTFALPAYLKNMGYRCEAIHPSSGANWNRIASYESMGFDEFITIDDFKNPEYVRYISDKESYKKVIERYENKKDGEPLYVFDMTIQNHGGYLTNTNWKNPVYPEGSHLAETKEFLSATKVSDDAFKYLVSYFKTQDEPTIICMFGDHHPSIEVEFYEMLLGKKQSDWELDDIQKRFATPFIIWANYDIEEAQDVVISNNYLENMLLKQAGVELPLYNQYIEKISNDIPAMNVNGYMDLTGEWHNYEKKTSDKVKELLHNYELLQYGYYSDSDKEVMAEIFRWNGN